MMVCNVVLQEQNVDVLMRIRSGNWSLHLGNWWCIYYPPFPPSLFSFLPLLLPSIPSFLFHLPTFPIPPVFPLPIPSLPPSLPPTSLPFLPPFLPPSLSPSYLPTLPLFLSTCTPLSPSLPPLFLSLPFSSSLSHSLPLSPPFLLSPPSLPPSLPPFLLSLLDVVWKGMKWFYTGQKTAHNTPSHSGS